MMDQVAQIREKLDIASFIAEYVPLKRAGRNFNTQCPFHNEKTPSFVVSPERQIWHCFGCGKGGDVFTFLMEYERLEFIEALRTLAKRTGIELRESSFDKTLSSQKDKIYGLNRVAAEFYHYVLTQHAVGKKALEYLVEERKINKNIIKTFLIGYAPKDGIILANYLLQKKKYQKDELVNAGLAFHRGGRMVDFFVNRIIFPLTDHRSNIVGFAGRIFSGESEIAKYVNTRETLVYHKGQVFFGLDTAKEDIKKNNKAIVVEGEFDVIASHQHGIKNVIAVKGTALTENQVALLYRYTNRVALCFDGDKAGQEAIKRSLPLLEKKGITTTVIQPTFGKDADEAIKKDASSFKKDIDKDSGVYDFLISLAFEHSDASTAEGKRKISEEILPILAIIENEIVKEHYMRKLSTLLDTSYESIVRQIEKIARKDTQAVQNVSLKDKRDRQERLEEYLIALIVQSKNPKEAFDHAGGIMVDYEFSVPAFKKIMDLLKTYFEKHSVFDQTSFIKMLPQELTASFDSCFLLPLSAFEDEKQYEKEIKTTVSELRQLYIKAHIKILGQKMKDYEDKNEAEKAQEFEQQLLHFTKLLKNVVK